MDKATIILTIISLFLALVSLAAIVLSIIAYRESTKAALKVSSKEHEMSENLKYMVLELIAVLRSIDAKAALGLSSDGKTDYTYEIRELQRLQSRPEFLLFLNSIENVEERCSIESLLSVLVLRSKSDNNIRDEVHSILERMKNHLNVDGVIKKVNNDYANECNRLSLILCGMSGIYTDYSDNHYKRNIKNENVLIISKWYDGYKDFVRYLVEIKKINDKILKPTSLPPFQNLGESTMDHNSNDNDNYQGEKMIFEKYQDEYEDFLNYQNNPEISEK